MRFTDFVDFGGRGPKTQPRPAISIAATSTFFIVIIASNPRFASPPPAAECWQRRRRHQQERDRDIPTAQAGSAPGDPTIFR
jgi:hypothetical protein